ncbi:hypothetical protein [Pseudoruegeria sp. HB172150]|uniref:hypothetical protein n=1 Tax=Pseudoruegeria sp. HB172150 TaxID=2721164 RepID=UPI00155310E0|nr:hypothetical protein [Pseudoruegeria sp. HB172150]
MRRGARIVLLLLLGGLSIALVFAPKYNPAVSVTERFNRDVAVASAATYVSLRAINAALSAVQEVEVGASFGASGSIQPLKWLEPVDDTVERVSELIFAVALVNGVLSIAIGPVAAIGFFLLAVGLMGRCGCEAHRSGWSAAPPGLRRAFYGCGAFGFALAIGVPFAFALGSWAGDLLTVEQWNEANATLNGIAEEARTMIGDVDASGVERGWRESLSAYLSAGGLFWDEADALLAASIAMGGVLLLRLVVLPAVILVAILYLMRTMLAARQTIRVELPPTGQDSVPPPL